MEVLQGAAGVVPLGKLKGKKRLYISQDDKI